MRAAPRGDYISRTNLAPKTAYKSVSMSKLLTHAWPGARKLHSERAELRQLLTDVVQIGM